MTQQDTRITHLCEQLGLEQVKLSYAHLAQEAATHQQSIYYTY
jgi:hypothetical protein